MALTVVDRAIQAFGAEGVSQDQNLAAQWAGLRTLRIADGPDAVSVFFDHKTSYLSNLLSGSHSASWSTGAETRACPCQESGSQQEKVK